MDKKKERKSVDPLRRCTDVFPPFPDPMGSYTGVTPDPFEIPVQDADDL